MNMELLWEKLEEPGSLLTQEFAECVLSIYKELKSENNQKIRHEVYEKIYRSIAKTNVYMGVYLYSVLVYLEFDTHVMEEFIEYVRKQDMLNYQNKYYLFYQIANMIFLHPELETEPVLTAKWRLLEQVKTGKNRDQSKTDKILAKDTKRTAGCGDGFSDYGAIPGSITWSDKNCFGSLCQSGKCHGEKSAAYQYSRTVYRGGENANFILL